jgi:hypothetical protein
MRVSATKPDHGASPAGWWPRLNGTRESFARHLPAADQRGQGRDYVDAAIMRILCRQRDPPSLHTLAYNPGNFMRTLAMPRAAELWSLTSLRGES